MTVSISAGSRADRRGLAFAPVIVRLKNWTAARSEQRRLERELQMHSDRDLAELGMSRSDIADVVRGTFRAA